MNKRENPYDLSVLKKLLSYTKAYRLLFSIAAVVAILYAGFAISRPYFLQKAIDLGILQKDERILLSFISLMFLMLVMEVTSQFTFIYLANWLGNNIVKDIRVALFQKMLGFKKQYYDNSSLGKLVTRTVNDMDRVGDIFSEGLFMIISDVLKMGTILVFMFYKSWELSLIVLMILPIIIIATRIFHKKMKVAFEQVRTQVANLNTFVQEHISGMKIVQLFAREDIEFNKFKSINEKHKQAWVKTVWYNSIFFPIAELSGSFAVGFIVWYGGLRSLEGTTISLGIVVMFIQLTNMLFRPLRQIADKFNTLQMGMVAAKRVFGVLETNNSINETRTAKLVNVKGAINFKDVRFSYLKGEEVVKGISFKVKSGQMIAIVGATGAGKSTIINLLNRFYDIDSGIICIDGIDIKSVPLVNLRKHIAVVQQDVFLFADTILNNITLKNPNITKDQVIASAKEIELHQFIEQLPNGYDYNVKERGGMLSSGQRQLISFLRAYVTQPTILVLDEATSSVDSNNEQLIQQATEKITKNRTSIVIAHRLATIKSADIILVMNNGKIVERGSHQELLLNPQGYYKKLYEVQFETQENSVM